MAIKVTDEMFAQAVEKNQKIQNLQNIRNSDFLTNPIQIIENNVLILCNYLEKKILTGAKPFKMDSLLMTYIFNVLESFNGFRDKKMKLIRTSKITENEKEKLFDIIAQIEGTDSNPKVLKIINIIRNHFHHSKIEGISMKINIVGDCIERIVFINGYPLIELVKNGLDDAKLIKQSVNNKISQMMSDYNMRDNTLRFNAYCRAHGRLDEVYILYPEESEEEIALYE